MYFLHVYDQKCELYNQQEQLLLRYEKGEVTEKVYNALNDRTLRILDNQVIAIPGLYRGTDAGSGRTQLYPISDVDYLLRVRRQSPFMRQLLAIFKPSASALKMVYIQVLHTFYQQIPLEDNNLMYTIKYTDDDQMVEEKYKYGTNPDIINIEDFTALIGYDLQFLKVFSICKRCKRLFGPKKNESFCSETCRIESSRHRSGWCDAQIEVKKKIDMELRLIDDQIDLLKVRKNEKNSVILDELEKTKKIYNDVYNTWMEWTKGGIKSSSAQSYILEKGQGLTISYTEYLLNWWEHFCAVGQMDLSDYAL